MPEATARKRPSLEPIRDLLPRVRPHAGALAGAGLFLVLSSAIGLVFPLVVGYLLDAAFETGNGALLDRIALVLLGLFALQAVFNFAQTYLLSATGERVVAKLRTDLFAHLLSLPAAFFADRRTGELSSRLSADVTLLQNLVSHQVSEFSRQVLYLVGAVVLLTITHARLTATTLLVVPIVVWAAFFFGRRLRRASTGVQDQVAEATAVAEQAVSQIRTVQGFAQEPAERQRYDGRIAAAVRLALGRAVTRGVFFGAITFAAFGAVTVVLWQGGRLVLAGDLTAGTLVAFLLYAVTVAAAVGTLASLYSSYQEAAGAAERVFELLGTESDVKDPARPAPLPRPIRGEVRFERVAFQYGDGTEPPATVEGDAKKPWSLQGIDLTLHPGETVALVGPSGAGKTSLAALIPRFWDPRDGRITLDGVDLRRLRLAELRGAVGAVPQETPLFSGTIRENIAYADPAASDEAVRTAARTANAEEFIRALPNGYATLVGERGIKLSGGQRQRIAIARALLKNPAVLILDEATSNLDAESEGLIEEALVTLLEGRTTLIIAHRLSTVRRADRVVVLDRGRIVEEGSHADLLEREDGLFARLHARQFGEEPEGGWQLAARG